MPGFDATTAEEEAYWYSRYSMMTLTRQSAMGPTFMPSMDQIMAAVNMVSGNPGRRGDAAGQPGVAARAGRWR